MLHYPPVMTTTPRSPARSPTRTSILKSGLALRRAARLGKSPIHRVLPRPHSQTSSHTRARESAHNYAARVLAREFEPTALKARELAEARGESLHSLAHRLGYAKPAPKVRVPVDLTSLTRSKLATLSGYSLSDVSRLLARRHPPTLTKLARISEAYGAWMDDVLSAIGW